jgi:hypothetical protein
MVFAQDTISQAHTHDIPAECHIKAQQDRARSHGDKADKAPELAQAPKDTLMTVVRWLI